MYHHSKLKKHHFFCLRFVFLLLLPKLVKVLIFHYKFFCEKIEELPSYLKIRSVNFHFYLRYKQLRKDKFSLKKNLFITPFKYKSQHQIFLFLNLLLYF